MKDWIKKSLGQWQNEKIPLNGPATAGMISACEQALNFKFPDDFVDLYLEVNGFTDMFLKDSMVALWSLDEIVERYQESGDKNFIGFADHLMHSWDYGFRRSKQGVFFDESRGLELVAFTVEEAVRFFNTDSPLIF